MQRAPLLLAASVLLVAGCLTGPDDPPAGDGDDLELGAQHLIISKQSTVDHIQSVAAARGITNPMLIAGIANGETNLTHCRADYYAQLCAQTAGTPISPSCAGGSVLVGNADSSCAQGGLGLFQLDYGTQAQTIAHYGTSVLSLDGNIGFGIDHIVEDVRICSLTPAFGTDLAVAKQAAIKWINNAKRGTADYGTFFMCMSKYYNGAGTQAEANYYRGKTEEVFNLYNTPAPPTAHTGTVNTDGTALNVRAAASATASVVGSVADGTVVTIKCQKAGDSVTGTYGTSNVWDDIGTGYVADVYVYTGSDGAVAPTCQ